MHDDLVAGHGHHGGIGAGLAGDVGHGADLFAGQFDEVVGQPLALQRGAAGAVDPQADEIHALVALFVDEPLDAGDLVGFDRAFELDADRPPGVAARGVAFVQAGRKLHLADHVAAVVGQELDDPPVAGLDAGELPGLARPLDRFLGEDAMFVVLVISGNWLGATNCTSTSVFTLSTCRALSSMPRAISGGTVRRLRAISS